MAQEPRKKKGIKGPIEEPVIERKRKEPIKPLTKEETKKRLLGGLDNFLKTSINGILQLPGQLARTITIIRKPDLQNQEAVVQEAVQLEDASTINRPLQQGAESSLSISIDHYQFTLVSKLVLFDRRFVNFDVSGGDLGQDIRLELTAYASSSQVGAWRLCKNEAGNRLNKFDDYVQSTVIQWELSRFICYWFYRYQLLWDDEPPVASGIMDPNRPDIKLTSEQVNKINAETTKRNTIRNNLFGRIDPLPGYNAHTIPDPSVISAIPYVYVMEGNLYQYQSLPTHYIARTAPDDNITCRIINRGLGSIISTPNPLSLRNNTPPHCNNIVNLPAPCPFNYWNLPTNGKCGDQNEEKEILSQLNDFSNSMNHFYEIENSNGVKKITELYQDCMVYKNFKQEATIYKVRLKAKEQNWCISTNVSRNDLNNNALPGDISEPKNFYKQDVDIVFVNYNIKQYSNPDVCLKSCYHLDPEPTIPLPEPSFNVQGYYVLSIIPTKVLLPPNTIDCDFNKITSIGLFKYYIKAGYFACKPLDYRGQCFLRSFFPKKIATINLEYAYIGHRLNGQWPFYDLFGFNDEAREILSEYTEQPILLNLSSTIGIKPGMTRTATLAKSDAQSGNTIIEYIDPKLLDDVNNYTDSLCALKVAPLKITPKTKPPPPIKGRILKKGGSNIHQKTRKTNKRRKHGQLKRKTMKKHFKKRKTKKIRTRV